MNARTELRVDALLAAAILLAGFAFCTILYSSESDPARPPLLFGLGLGGLLLPRIKKHRYRVLGLVPIGFIAVCITTFVAHFAGGWCEYTISSFGLFLGIGIGAMLRYRDAFRSQMIRSVVVSGLAVASAVAIILLYRNSGAQLDYGLALRVGSTLLAVASCILLFRAWVEIMTEWFVRIPYNVRAVGPGVEQIPRSGPCLVIANHASWFDPLFLAKVVRRPIKPIMTERFYRKWYLHPLLKYVFHVIVVPEVGYRRDAPEIGETIEALRDGECIVIFPEGYLRRDEEKLLRKFGRGIWQITQACPDVPVFACWIEGSWGSYTSFMNGPPTRNKRFDINRPITVAVQQAAPHPQLDAENHLAVRNYYMDAVLESRKLLNLPDPPNPSDAA